MAWREPHGLEGGERQRRLAGFEELRARVGAGIMGRKMYSGGTGGWDDDPQARGWWGEDPPFHTPVFVLTHHAREPLAMEGGTTFTFVTDGIESAYEQAQAAAGDKDVQIHGGGSAISQCLSRGAAGRARDQHRPGHPRPGRPAARRRPAGRLELLETSRPTPA